MYLTSGTRPRFTAPVGLVTDAARTRLRWALFHGIPRVSMRLAKDGDPHAELVSAQAQRDPEEAHRIARRVLEHGPLQPVGPLYFTARHDVVKEVLSSNDFATGTPGISGTLLGRLAAWSNDTPQLGPLQPPSLLVTEPPDHTRYRKLVTRVFSVKAIERLRDRTAEVAQQLLDDLEAQAGDGAPVDLVSTYCALLPVTVIAEILGVPEADRELVLRFGQAAAPSLDFGQSWQVFRDVERGLAEFQTWLAAHLDGLRSNPGDDLLSQLVAVRESGEGLDDAELMATAGLVLAAGFETTVNLLGNAVALLDEHPEQLRLLQDDPSLWPTAVDEALRVDPPVLMTGRHAVRATTVAGREVPRGTWVTTMLAGANRDPRVFTDPDTFDVTRANARDHVAFSAGRHFCLGAALARMEGEVGLQALFERFPDLRVADGARRRPTRILRGYEHLPVLLTPAASAPSTGGARR